MSSSRQPLSHAPVGPAASRRWSRRLVLTAVPAAALVTLGACSSRSSAPHAEVTATPHASGTVVVPPSVSTLPTDVPVQLDNGQEVSQGPAGPSVLDAPSKNAAAKVATRAMALFARPTVPADRWWTDLKPLLTDDAALAYRGTDPVNILATKVTGGATVLPDSVPLIARVSVPTDEAIYLLILARTPERPDRWLVTRFVEPEVGD